MRKSHTSTADLLTWTEAPQAVPPTSDWGSRRSYQVGPPPAEMLWFFLELCLPPAADGVFFRRALAAFGRDQQGAVRRADDGGGGRERAQEVRSGRFHA